MKHKNKPKKLKRKLHNYGYKVPTITPDNYLLGGLGISNKEILNPDMDWTSYLPTGEYQKINIETQNCVAFGTLNCLEILHRRLYLSEINYSDRFLGIVADTDPYGGNDPNTVAQAIRHFGLVEEKSLPYDNFNNPEDYFKPKPPTDSLLKEAQNWLKNYVFQHEYVFTGGSIQSKQEKLLEALKYSPVGVSVMAWRQRDGLYVKNEGEQDNHWCVLVKGEKNKPWQIMDSYSDDDFLKELDWNYDFGVAKLFTLKLTEKKVCWFKTLFKKVYN